jgi:hypothetical protein
LAPADRALPGDDEQVVDEYYPEQAEAIGDATPADIVADLDAFAQDAQQMPWLIEARAEATKGSAAMRAWYAALTLDERVPLQVYIPELQQIAHRADASAPIPEAASQPAPAEMPAPTRKEVEDSLPEPNDEPPRALIAFHDVEGEVWEYESAIEAASAYMDMLGTIDGAEALQRVWQAGSGMRGALIGNGNLLAEVDAAYMRARHKFALDGLDQAGIEAAQKGVKALNSWIFGLNPEARKRVRADRARYERIARSAKP